jgi:hypothetical protein
MKHAFIAALLLGGGVLSVGAPAVGSLTRPGNVGLFAQASSSIACFSCIPQIVPPVDSRRDTGTNGHAVANAGGGGSSGGPFAGSPMEATASAEVDEPGGFMRAGGAASAMAGFHADAFANSAAVIDDTITLSEPAIVVLEGTFDGRASGHSTFTGYPASVGLNAAFRGPFVRDGENSRYPFFGGVDRLWGVGEESSESFGVPVALPAGQSFFNAEITPHVEAVSDLQNGASATASASLTFRILLPAGVTATSGSGLLPIVGLAPPANTATGVNVSFGPSNGVSLTFDQVTSAGDTNVVKSTTGPAPPSGFSVGEPPTYYELSTTAGFTGTVLVCVDTAGISFTASPRLFHYESAAWVDVTDAAASTAATICGRVSSLSPFALFAAPPNRAPGPPGLPEGPATNNGVFRLEWAAAEDPDGDAVTYRVEHKDANDPGFTEVASGLSDTFYQFDRETEGTWVYRVTASDGTYSSAPSPESPAIKLDRSSPLSPNIAYDRPPDYTGQFLWWADSLTLTPTDNGDAVLADGSPGSGVALVSPPQVTSGSGFIGGVACVWDAVGWSTCVGLGNWLDGQPPAVTIDCPAGPVLLGAARTVIWNASDAHSGLATAATGSLNLDTASVGEKKTVTPVARDNVGHTAIASCTYWVVYDFGGFFSPVDNLPTLNQLSAGRAVPVKFSLGGNFGLNVVAVGYPRSEPISCDAGAIVDGVEETVTAGTSSLAYDASSGQYRYVWKTEQAWAGTCRQLVLKLADGTYRRANFTFRT